MIAMARMMISIAHTQNMGKFQVNSLSESDKTSAAQFPQCAVQRKFFYSTTLFVHWWRRHRRRQEESMANWNEAEWLGFDPKILIWKSAIYIFDKFCVFFSSSSYRNVYRNACVEVNLCKPASYSFGRLEELWTFDSKRLTLIGSRSKNWYTKKKKKHFANSTYSYMLHTHPIANK